jgi:hypothetical protein
MKKKTELLKGQNKDLQVSMNYKLGRWKTTLKLKIKLCLHFFYSL